MSRPLYENKAHLAKEFALADELAVLWKCEFEKLPIRYGVDYLIMRKGTIVGFCEMKVREYEMDQLERMGGFMLSLGKWLEGLRLRDVTGMPFVIAIKLLDGIYWHSVTGGHDGMKIGGRKDRGDWQDVEPVVLLKRARFTKLI